jgi:uroporphyrinogen III methyltransferase/synthase
MPRSNPDSSDRPLQGVRVAVTRPTDQAERLIEGLGRLGADTLACPTIRIGAPANAGGLAGAVENLDQYDWIVFTSVNGVRRFRSALGSVMQEPRLPGGTRVAAIGPATADELVSLSVVPEVVPEEFVAEAVADALIAMDDIAGRRVLLPRAAGARKVLPERLAAAGAVVEEVVAYEAYPNPEGIEELRGAMDRGEVDWVTFTASSTVRHFVEHAGPDFGEARVAVIGPITAEAAGSLGVRVDVEAEEYTVDGLLRAISDYYTMSEERG